MIVVQRRGGAGLAQEALAGLGPGGDLGPQDLQGDAPPQGEILRQEDQAHPPLAEQP